MTAGAGEDQIWGASLHLNEAQHSKDFYQDFTYKYSTKNLGQYMETQNFFFYIFITQ